MLKKEWIRPSFQIHKPKVHRVYSGPGLILQSSLEGILSEVFCVILLTNQPTDANVHTAISLAVVYPAVTVVVGPILYRTIQP